MNFFLYIYKGADSYLIPYNTFKLDEEINKTPTLSFSVSFVNLRKIIDTYGENQLVEGYCEVSLFDENNTKLFGGYLAEYSLNRGADQTANYSLVAKGFFGLLQKRYTQNGVSYTSTDSSDIAWSLIEYTQGLDYGDIGITRGANPVTVDRDRTFRNKEIADAIIDMSNETKVNGFDFEITADKEFNIYYPEKGISRDEIIFDGEFNLINFQVSKIGIDGMINQAIVIGEGNDIDMPVVVRNSEAIYQETYNLQQEVFSEKDTSIIQNLEDKGDRFINMYKFPRYTINFSCDFVNPDYNGYQLGDRAVIILNELEINEEMRITKKGVNEKGIVSITMRQTL